MKFIALLPAVIWSFLVFYLSIIPAGEFDKLSVISFDHADKIAHFLMYGILAFLLAAAMFVGFKASSKKCMVFSFFPPFILGFITEIIQFYLIRSRTGSVADLLANSLGIVAGIVLATSFKKYFSS